MSIRHDRDLRFRKSRNRKPRPKSFKTKEKADEYAKGNGINDYVIVPKGKKFIIRKFAIAH